MSEKETKFKFPKYQNEVSLEEMTSFVDYILYRLIETTINDENESMVFKLDHISYHVSLCQQIKDMLK